MHRFGDKQAMQIPQLTIGKKPDEHMNITMMLGYPADTPFGNLNLAEFEMFERVDYLNRAIECAYRTWEAHVPKRTGFVPQAVKHLRLQVEDVVYSLRKLVDTAIAMSYVLGEYVTSGAYPKRIAVDCIGRLLEELKSESAVPAALEPYRAHSRFLAFLNEVSNSYKHHFANHELGNIIAAAEPCAFFFESNRNKAGLEQTLRSASLSKLCEATNRLLADARESHRQLLSQFPR